MEDLFLVSIREDVVFPDGEEVEELLSISLDPQVVIEPKMEGTSLTGTIEITGEYSIAEEEEENIRQFFRHIPVQAFIPPNRQTAEDTDIQIHSFDYDVQKPGRLMLAAELAVALVDQEEMTDEFAQDSHIELPVMEMEEEEEVVETNLHEDSPVMEEEASVQVQKGNADAPSIFSWLEEQSEKQAQWRFSIEKSGDVELISTQGEAQPQEE
ncbi:hypothetical protein BTO30_05940 [Domibacillus antri]|uniref:Stage VI sporulation protein D N-terminal domain-containing protein n=1 Tax=Domibacillus antri TaxID=1714264 RepID=A0A1Q8Q835_9BACI|nr:hypothetical protein [Domibacillus antri]OLN23498.1 hypothetical protein BTO30_05940 [Domibacillus antri]